MKIRLALPSAPAGGAKRPRSPPKTWLAGGRPGGNRCISTPSTTAATAPYRAERRPVVDPYELLRQPTWSVRSLLPAASTQDELSVAQLQHLAQLSALRIRPADMADTADALRSQLHFVRDIQSVDTAGFEPLRSIRDETEHGLQEQTVGLEQLREALSREETFGHSKRPRRRRDSVKTTAGWDALATASQKAGKYFVVRSS